MQKKHLTKTKHIHEKSQKNRNKEELPQFDKDYLQKSAGNITLNGESLNAFFLRQGTRQDYLVSPLLCNTVLEVLTSAIRKEKETKLMQIKKEAINSLY